MTYAQEPILDDAYDKCPDCGSYEIESDERRSERICILCGVVLNARGIIQEKIEKSKLKKFQVRVETHKRTYYNYLKVDIRQMNSISNKDIAHLTKSEDLMRAFKRNKHVDRREVMRNAIMRIKIGQIIQLLNIPEYLHLRTLYLLKKLTKKYINCTGRKLAHICICLLYIACREAKYPILVQDFKDYSLTSHKLMLNLKFIRHFIDFKLKPAHPKDFINRFISELEIDHKHKNILERAVTFVLNRVPEEKYWGKRPSVFTAAAIWLLSPLVIQKDIAEIAKCTEVTLRNLSRIIRPYIPV